MSSDTVEVRPPEQSLGFMIYDVARLMRRDFNRRVQKHGLTQAQWQVIAYLVHNEGMKQAELASILEVQPISVARLIDRMQAAGWVERRPDPNDRRAVNLHLMPKAKPIVDKLYAEGAIVRGAALEGLSAKEQETLRTCLNRMRQNLIGACRNKDDSNE